MHGAEGEAEGGREFVTIKGLSRISILFVILSCGGERDLPRKIVLSNVPSYHPSRPTEIKTLEQALAAVITICREDLGLPTVDPLHVYLYKNSASFAWYGRLARRPSEVTHEAAFARENEIHVDLEKVGPAITSARLWAHEYAHNIGNEIGKAKRTPFFIHEGFAEWVAARVLHVLGWQDHAITRHLVRRELSRHRNALPDIVSLHENWKFKDTAEQSMGMVKAYGPAFLAVDRFIQKKGLAVALESIRNGDLYQYGKPLEELTADLMKSLSQAAESSKSAFSVGRPNWKVGYTWSYLSNEYGSSRTTVKKIIAEESFRGAPVFVVETGADEELYTKDSFAFVGSRRDGKLISEVDKAYQFVSWPLERGKEWRISFTHKDLPGGSRRDYDQIIVVMGSDKIRVRAGEYHAIKLESYGALTGHLRAEYWYSPEAKWFVKARIYTQFGVAEEDLSTSSFEKIN
jgi:hypothetical protein